jgi:hypothetical protein
MGLSVAASKAARQESAQKGRDLHFRSCYPSILNWSYCRKPLTLTLGSHPSLWNRARRSRSEERYPHPEGLHAAQDPNLRTEDWKIRNYNNNIHIIAPPFQPFRQVEELSVKSARIRGTEASQQDSNILMKISLIRTTTLNDDYNIYLFRNHRFHRLGTARDTATHWSPKWDTTQISSPCMFHHPAHHSPI